MVEISVLIPNRNYADFISQTIESVLNQTYKDFEVIVCDDNSTDNSVEVIKKYPVKLVLKRDEKPSISGCRNWLLREAKGKYISYLSSDDYWEPEFLEIMIKSIKEKNVKGVYCDANVVDISGNTINKKYYLDAKTRPDLWKKCAIPECIIGFSACMISKEVFDDVGEFDEKLVFGGEEIEWAIRAIRYYYFCHVEKCLTNRRNHPKQTFPSIYKNEEELESAIRKLEKVILAKALKWIKKREGIEDQYIIGQLKVRGVEEWVIKELLC